MGIFDGYDTDKGNGYHSYEKVYEEYLVEPGYFGAKAVLELGILRGGSLRCWRDLLPSAHVYGMDIDTSTMIHGEDRITTIVGSCFDRDDLKAIGKYGPFDLIIDDASHVPIHQYQALKYLWPQVARGGLYFIEDMDMAKNGADVLSTISHILRGTTAQIELHLGPGTVRCDDMVILEKR